MTADHLSENLKYRLNEVRDDIVAESLDRFMEKKKRKSFRNNGKEFGVVEEHWEHEDSFLSQLQGDTRMDVSEVDVARIVPRVISHRLRVRDGPDHEIFSSVIYPAASPNVQRVEKHRMTIKEIIVKLLFDT
jgi:hypothetical protein